MNQTGNTNDRFKDKRIAKGHEIPLSSLTKHRTLATVGLMDGTKFECLIHGFDKWTISIIHPGSHVPVTYFKHAIASFTSAEK